MGESFIVCKVNFHDVILISNKEFMERKFVNPKLALPPVAALVIPFLNNAYYSLAFVVGYGMV